MNVMKNNAPRLILFLIVGLVNAPGAARPWSHVPCDPEFREARDRHARELLEARPGDPHYVPFPFPATHQEAIENFIHVFEETMQGVPRRRLDDGDRGLLDALQGETATFDVVIVSD